MASAQESPESSPENSFIPLARTLARSRIGQLVVSILTLALFTGLSWLAWHTRDFTAELVTWLLICVGAKKAWDYLPFKITTRQRWAQNGALWEKHQKMLEGHPAYMWRSVIWVGVFRLMDDFWKTDFTALPSTSRLIGSAIFITIGLGCTLICWRAIQRAEMSHA